MESNQKMEIDNIRLSEEKKSVIIIDQTKLPNVTQYLTLGTAEDIYDAILQLKVRGAPAIGICAGYGIYCLAKTIVTTDYEGFINKFHEYK